MQYQARKAEEQASHDEVIRLVVKVERFTYEDKTTFTNPGQDKNKSAGTVRGEERYPDIVVVENSTRKPVIIAEIETESSVNEEEAVQWTDYASLNLTFYLYVPDPKVESAIKIIDSKSLRNRIYGLRGYTVSEGKIQINDIWPKKQV